MSRKVINARLNRDTLNDLNDNFKELYDDYNYNNKDISYLKSMLIQNNLSDEKIQKLIDASPKGVFENKSELEARLPKGAVGIYLTSDDGKWNFWDGTSWVSGGTYQAEGVPKELIFSAKNLIHNGDFSNGITNFGVYGGDANYDIYQTALSLTGKGGYGTTGIYTVGNNQFETISGNKIFIKARMRVNNSECSGFKILLGANGKTVALGGGQLVTKPLINTWYEVSDIIEIPVDMSNSKATLYFLAEYPSKDIANGKVFEIYRPMAIDLTKSLGKGQEWSKQQTIDFLSNYNGNWFDGSKDIITVKDYLIDTKKEVNTLKEIENKRNTYDLIDDFSTGWSTSEPSSSLKLNDTARINLTNTTSLKMESINSQGAARSIDKQFNLTLNDKPMMIKVWIEDTKAIDYINVYFGNEADTWGNYCRFAFGGDASGDYSKSGGILRQGWNYLSINKSEMIKTNNFNWSLPVKRLRVTITPKTNDKTTVVLDSIWNNGKNDPKFVITFDDAWRTVYKNAYPKMKENGIVGTTYVIGEYIDNVRDFSNWFMTVDMLKELEKAGWTSGNHTWMHNYYFGHNHTPESYVATIEKNRDWLLNNHLGGYDSGALHVCYPNGEYDLNVTSMLQAKGFKSARAAGARGSHPVQIDKHYELLSRSFSKNVTLEQAKKWIDIGLEAGGTTFLQFHQIPLDDTTTNGQENPYISWSKDKFEALIDYIVQKGLVGNCMTHAEWFEYAKRNNLLND